MTLEKAIQILQDHQKWRLGADTEMTDPKELTEAIDIALNLLTNMTAKDGTHNNYGINKRKC